MGKEPFNRDPDERDPNRDARAEDDQETRLPAPADEDEDDDDDDDDEDDGEGEEETGDTAAEVPADLEKETTMGKALTETTTPAVTPETPEALNVTSMTSEELVNGIGEQFMKAMEPAVTHLTAMTDLLTTLQKSVGDLTEQNVALTEQLDTFTEKYAVIEKALTDLGEIQEMSKAINAILDKSAQTTAATGTTAPTNGKVELLEKALIPSPLADTAPNPQTAVLEKALPLMERARKLRDERGVVLPSYALANSARNAGTLGHYPEIVERLETELAAA